MTTKRAAYYQWAGCGRDRRHMEGQTSTRMLRRVRNSTSHNGWGRYRDEKKNKIPFKRACIAMVNPRRDLFTSALKLSWRTKIWRAEQQLSRLIHWNCYENFTVFSYANDLMCFPMCFSCIYKKQDLARHFWLSMSLEIMKLLVNYINMNL